MAESNYENLMCMASEIQVAVGNHADQLEACLERMTVALIAGQILAGCDTVRVPDEYIAAAVERAQAVVNKAKEKPCPKT